MLEPKPIPKDAVPAALEKALRYRLLHEPLEAESICRDILRVEPDNQKALALLVLALTDQFHEEGGAALDEAKTVLQRLQGDYERAYYEGIIHERWGKAQLARSTPGHVALRWFREAMRCYQTAEALRAPDDPDPILRWNACLRFLQRRQEEESLEPYAMTHDVEVEFGDEIPPR